MATVTPISSATAALAVYAVNLYHFPHHRVRLAWENACHRWQIFGYSPPRVNRSILEAKEGMDDARLAYINLAEKKVTANLHRLGQNGMLDLLETIFGHELGHKFCPGDLKTKLLLDHAAKKMVEDESLAPMIGNLFRDMLVNVELHRRGDKNIATVYSRMWQDQPDAVQQLIGRAYEKLFQGQDTSRYYAQTIIRTKPSPEIEKDAERITALVGSARRSNWLDSTRQFAEIVKKYLPQMGEGKTYVISPCNASDFSSPHNSLLPPKGKADLRTLERRLSGVTYDLGKADGKGGKQPCSIPEFRQFLLDSNINVTPEEALIWYYRDLVSGKVVKVPEVTVYSGSLYPRSPKTWRPGDPPGELDVTLSLSIGGVLIPGVTTKKWQMARGEHLSVGRDYPDLDLWIDSSGSMDHPAKEVSHAVSSGMIVAKSFLATRKAVRVISFSGMPNGAPLFESTAGFVRDEDEIDHKLARYLGMCTTLPMEEIEKPYLAKSKEKYIVLITDMEIQNMDKDTVARLTRVFKASVGGTVFLIGEGKEGVKKILVEIGFDVVPVKSIADLDRHALQLTRKLFEERIAI